ncbi:hypothetical protein POM88_042864 [Heracleum sosnowskyi]|uniref:Retrotransposon gag domain-containing protein n=1 Tax=Heracleum sosnowskyi TaxID=360622 RepID=A0AAD8HJ70_9APIA|nr:hypothetical protein POM88_042864 [Heracleum sosnowskyi]
MSDQPETTTQSPETQLVSMEQMEQMFQLFQKLHKNTNLPETGIPQTVRVAEKLNFTNYTKWCKLMHIVIGGRGWLNHITANPVPPNDPEYQQWAQKDSTVLSWIIENIDGDLVNQFMDYKTARELWKGIETLLSSGRDELQIYDLSSKAATMRQGKDTIEVYFSKLNTLWKEIDRRMPNPMKCAEDITSFNSFIQRQRLYQFLAGVSDTLDKEKRDILYQDPLPTLDAAYASIRREIARRGIMANDSSLGREPSKIEWWDDLKQRKTASKAMISWTDGKANLAVGDPDGNNNISLTTALHLDQTADPTTQVGNTTDVAPETSVSPLLSTPVPSDEHPSDDLSSAEVDSENPGTDTITETNTIPSGSVPNRRYLVSELSVDISNSMRNSGSWSCRKTLCSLGMDIARSDALNYAPYIHEKAD